MSYNAIVFRVMIASPSDVTIERNLVREALSSWNAINSDSRKVVLLPVGWETHVAPAMGEHPQAIINKRILKNCDLLVGVFWTRVGTATGEYVSGTVEEIEEHIKAGKPAMIYFSSAPVRPDSVDPEQYELLKHFKDSCKERGIYATYDDHNDFREKFSSHLQITMNTEEYFKLSEPVAAEVLIPVQIGVPMIPAISKEAIELLVSASMSQQGQIMRLPHAAGLIVQTHGKNYVEDGNPRSEALWESVIKELEREDLIDAASYERHMFNVTRKGYELAEVLQPK